MLSKVKLENLIVALLAISVILLVGYEACPREVVVAPGTQWFADTDNDFFDGGSSVIENLSNEDGFAFRYQLKPDIGYPFTLFLLSPRKELLQSLDEDQDWRMVDIDKSQLPNMDWVEDVSIKARIEGKPKENFRFYFRSRSDELYDVQDTTSRRYAQSLFTLTEELQEVVLERDMFHVPTWWLDQHALDTHLHAKPDLSPFEWLEITPSTTDFNEEITVYVDSITLRGHWISPPVFYSGVLGMWLALAVGVLGTWVARITGQLQSLKAEAEKFRDRAFHDCLTGLMNRHGVSEEMPSLVEFSTGEDKLLSIVLFDIDHFKILNDTHGHAYGDAVLKEVGSTISAFANQYSMKAIRWGGEEFLVVVPDQGREATTNLAEKIRQTFESQAVITCSFGVYQLQRGDTLSDAIERADRALYFAKYKGRNQVAVFQGDANGNAPAQIVTAGDIDACVTVDHAGIIAVGERGKPTSNGLNLPPGI